MRRFRRRVAQQILRLFPTCDLQNAIETREGIKTYWFKPGEMGRLSLPNQTSVPLKGPMIVTTNID